MLTERQRHILELVIGEYVDSAQPIGSRHISTRYDLGVSPATVRSEMGELEAQGYLNHPHTSAGRVPTELGYRFFVEWLMREEDLPWDTQQTIRHQFHQARGAEASMHLAAAVLARSVQNAAVVTAPRTAVSRIKHLQLVGLHETAALLVLVLDEGRLEQEVLNFDEVRDQEALGALAGRLTRQFAGLRAHEVEAKLGNLDGDERLVMEAVASTMRSVDEGSHDEAYLEGLRNVLSQPEFSHSDRVLALLELLDQRLLTRTVRALAGEGVTVFIGADNPRLAEAGEAFRECSVVVGSYGLPGHASGVLAVLGPMRMRYSRTISTVRYLSNVMSELLSEGRD